MRGDLGQSPLNNYGADKRFGLIDPLAAIIQAR
jgi:hypothetical protein